MEYIVIVCLLFVDTQPKVRKDKFCSVLCDFGLRYASHVGVAGSRIWSPYLVVPGRMPRAQGMAAYVRDKYEAFHQPKFQCGCCEMLVFRVCGARHNLYVFSLCHYPDLYRCPDF